MKVISFDRILEIKNKTNYNKSNLKERMKGAYEPSQKLLKFTKKKVLLSKINFDISLKPSVEVDLEAKYKNIMIALNKINMDNIDEVTQELMSLKIDNYNIVYKLTESILKKIFNESNYIDCYLKIVDNLSRSDNWCVDFNEIYRVNLREAFILKIQETFEKNIFVCEKDFGVRLMFLLSKIFSLDWIDKVVCDNIIDTLLNQNNTIFLEYVIVFIKSVKTEVFSRVKDRILTFHLNTRLRFMLEED